MHHGIASQKLLATEAMPSVLGQTQEYCETYRAQTCGAPSRVAVRKLQSGMLSSKFSMEMATSHGRLRAHWRKACRGSCSLRIHLAHVCAAVGFRSILLRLKCRSAHPEGPVA